MKKQKEKKLYVIRKYIKATDIQEAIKLEKNRMPDDVWLDDVYKTESVKMGFQV